VPTLGPMVAPADFDETAEIWCEGSFLQKIVIANNSAIIELAEKTRDLSGPAVPFNTKMPLPPGIYDMARKVERIRFKRLTEVKPFPMITVIA
jgi:hypothetical protein